MTIKILLQQWIAKQKPRPMLPNLQAAREAEPYWQERQEEIEREQKHSDNYLAQYYKNMSKGEGDTYKDYHQATRDLRDRSATFFKSRQKETAHKHHAGFKRNPEYSHETLSRILTHLRRS